MIRGLVYWFVGSLASLLWGVMLFLAAPFTRRREHMFHVGVGLWATFLLRVLCGVHIDVRGLDNLESGRNYVIVSNHRSYTDILVGNAALPIQFRWLAKKSLFKIPIIGWSMFCAGYIPVVRERAIAASQSLQKTAGVLRSGVSVWIFPEGTRTPEQKLGNFKRGAFRLARQTGTPLLPVVFTGTDDIFVKPCRIRSGQVRVDVLEPIDPQLFEKDGISERVVEQRLQEATRETIQRSYDARTSASS
jgi:1-acyl-sn-glycerol-3-phosphate acyltransferase